MMNMDSLRAQMDSRLIFCMKSADGIWRIMPPEESATAQPLISAFEQRFPVLAPKLDSMTIRDGAVILAEFYDESITLRREYAGWEIYLGEFNEQLSPDEFADQIALHQALLDALRQLNQSY